MAAWDEDAWNAYVQGLVDEPPTDFDLLVDTPSTLGARRAGRVERAVTMRVMAMERSADAFKNLGEALRRVSGT